MDVQTSTEIFYSGFAGVSVLASIASDHGEFKQKKIGNTFS